jgi:hypothetical protein
VLGGDFNVVRHPSKRLGAMQMSTAMQGFSDFIFSNGLVDIPLTGGRYTWSNNHSKSRLDRFLYTPIVEEIFSKIV